MHPRPIPALTGLRFVAAMTVVLAHSSQSILHFPHQAPMWHAFFIALSGIGMPLFFVLSGFVIYYNYSQSITSNFASGTYDFLVARFARLYPLYILCIFFDLAFNWGYGQLPHATGSALPFYLTMTQSWAYLRFDGTFIISMFGQMPQVSWSVSTEAFFYLSFPAACLLIGNLRSVRALGVTFAVLAVAAPLLLLTIKWNESALVRLSVAWLGPAPTKDYDVFSWFTYLSPYVEIVNFLMGCTCAALFMHLRDVRITQVEQRCGLIATIVAALSIAVLYCLFWVAFPNWSIGGPKFYLGIAPAMAILIFCCARYENAIVALLSSPRLVLGGEASYSIYMLHVMTNDAFTRLVGPVGKDSIIISNCLIWIMMLAATIGLSLVSWQLIEIPARRFLRRLLMVKPSSPTVLSTVS